MNENKFLKDFFTKKYSDSIGNSNFYIAFEDCGFHISKESFVDEITKQFSENVQDEQLSQDCDIVIPVCDTIMGHSVTNISDCVELLKSTITVNDKKYADNIDNILPIFGSYKDKLNSLFKSSASTINPNDSYYKSTLNPDTFLDETNSGLWTPYNESWAFPSKTPTGDPQQPGKAPAAVWKIRPDLVQNLLTINMPPLQTVPTPSPQKPNVRFATMAHSPVRNLTERPAVEKETAKPATARAPVNLQASTFLMKNALSAKDMPAAIVQPKFSKTAINSSLLNRNLKMQRFVLNNDVGKKEDTPVNTSTVNISFKYCIVNIRRSWFYSNILDISQFWYCISLPEGYFSSGEQSAMNKGKLPSLPVSMILIKDLSITATFNAGDWENAKNAVALDSLNIAEADFKDLGNNQHLIESKGVQIIGWMCEYLPKFPVCSDPDMVTP